MAVWQEIDALAKQLGERDRGPLMQVRRIVDHYGIEPVQILVIEVLAIEADGGLLLPDGVTRRTPGGVFFYLVRTRATPEEKPILFPPWSKPKRPAAGTPTSRTDAPRPPAQAVPAFVWTDRLPLYRDLALTKGVISTVKVTLVGRPGTIITKGDLVMTMMDSMRAPANFPKGVPAPPRTPTTYTVYIATKQWNKVAQSLQNAEDVLIVEGFAAYDPALEGVAVFANTVTTKLLQHQKRRPE